MQLYGSPALRGGWQASDALQHKLRNEEFYMKRKRYLFHAVIIAVLNFILIGSVFAAERSVIIRFHKQPGIAETERIDKAHGKIRRFYKAIPALAAKLSEQEIEKLRKDPNIVSIEEDAVVSAVQPVSSTEYADSWGVQHIGADVAHNRNIRGAGVKVAVLDTGIDCTHPDLIDNCKGGYNFVCDKTFDPTCDSNNPMDDSYNSHGTNIAGIIAARGNGTGVVGVAPEASLYALKVLDGGGFGSLSDILEGIDWAINNQMDVLNISISDLTSYPALKDVCDAAYQAGLVIVAAAGNTNGGAITYPALYDSVIAVTATDKNDQQTSFSAVGPELSLSAPGVNILSTAAGAGYAALSGTSQAAPHVAGTAALILSSGIKENGGYTNIAEEVRLRLQNSSKDLGDPGKDIIYGYGLVDAAKAVTSEPEQTVITLTRNHKRSFDDIQSISLSDALYTITIQNRDLKTVWALVFENGHYREDLSSAHHFNSHKKGQEKATISLDSKGTTLDVYLVPFGKTGTSADIVITKESSL